MRLQKDSENIRTGITVEAIKRDFLDNLYYLQARFPEVASLNDYYQALSFTVRDRLLERWIKTAKHYKDTSARTVCYFSAEFMPGPHLEANLLSLDMLDKARQAMEELDLDLDELIEQEEEPGLGSGGLGRLAACYMESMTTLHVPAIGYGIRYEFGIFDQAIENGWQVELTDNWLRFGNPWEITRPTISYDVNFGGHTENWTDDQGRYRVRWVPTWQVRGLACDTPIQGYHSDTANLLRLWKAQAVESFSFKLFNVGDYYGSVNQKIRSETISRVLYPNDEQAAGRALRLMQQYFFVSCSLQDMIRIHLQVTGKGVEQLHEKYVVQLNDTHPALAVPELMRLLVDVHLLPWDKAWDITRKTFAYTNHTLLPEALETWPLSLIRHELPRHLEIIYEINQRFLDEVRLRYPGDNNRIRQLSIIDDGHQPRVRMANLACVGSSHINGVAALHTELLKSSVLRLFYELWPDKFSNKTNGVTPRRFLLQANPRLSALIDTRLGKHWITQLDELRRLAPLADDAEFQQRWRAVKLHNKARLARVVKDLTGTGLEPEWMFDVQVKRIHEYKRQHLNALHMIVHYLQLKRQPEKPLAPRAFILAGKAAPGYFMAKLIIKLVNSIAEVVNKDPDVNRHMRVVFIPDFNVKNSQPIYPAIDLSEQISLAGKEASGTGNFKAAMNGGLTVGTLDGANIEIRAAVGEDNFFAFGLDTGAVHAWKSSGYHPAQIYETNAELREAIDLIASGHFSSGDTGLFRPLVDSLLHHDPYMVLADFQSYLDTQRRISSVFLDEATWTRMSILNVAGMGHFSSDRAIREYCRDIWHIETDARQPGMG